jgi:hypothetical protein
VVPDQCHFFSKKTYVLLSYLFAALTGLAPGVYNLFREPVQATDDTSTTTIQYQGLVFLFLVGGVFTMTGVFAQLNLTWYLLADLTNAGALSAAIASDLQRLIVVLAAALWIYGVVSAAQAAVQQSEPASQPTGLNLKVAKSLKRAGMPLAALDRKSNPEPVHALPDWRLL